MYLKHLSCDEMDLLMRALAAFRRVRQMEVRSNQRRMAASEAADRKRFYQTHVIEAERTIYETNKLLDTISEERRRRGGN